jgi:hypothetical protein
MANGCLKDDQIVSTDGNIYIYFPMKVGNVWYYDVQGSENNPWIKRAIKEQITIANKKYLVIEDVYGYSGQFPNKYSDTLRLDDQRNIWKHIKGIDYLLFDFTKKDSGTYKFKGYSQNPDYEYVVTIKRYELLKINDSTYENCIEFFFDIPISVDDEKWYIFAQDIGIIKEAVGEGPTIILNSYQF